MKKFIAIFGCLAILATVYLTINPSPPVEARRGLGTVKTTAHNETGISEAAVRMNWKQPFGEFDIAFFTIDPVTTIAGSGCTVEGGTTSFPSLSVALPFYTNGGVTFAPSSLGMNEILAIWPAEMPNIDGVKGRSGTTEAYFYRFGSDGTGSSSGTTDWRVKVYYKNTSAVAGEICTTSGGSIYVGPYVGRGSDLLSGVSLNCGTSTTFYATNQIGWTNGVTPYFFAIGRR